MRTRLYTALCLLLMALVASSCLTPTPQTVEPTVDNSAIDRQRAELQDELMELSAQLGDLRFNMRLVGALRQRRNELREKVFSGNAGFETLMELNEIDESITRLRMGMDDDEFRQREEYLESRIKQVEESLSNLPRSSPGMREEKGGGGEGEGGGGCGDGC